MKIRTWTASPGLIVRLVATAPSETSPTTLGSGVDSGEGPQAKALSPLKQVN